LWVRSGAYLGVDHLTKLGDENKIDRLWCITKNKASIVRVRVQS
jgi:hypothetical protein